MTPEAGRWIMLFGTIAWLTHVAKIIALYILLWRTKEEGRRGAMDLMVFLLFLAILVLLPYQDQKASKAMNKFLMVATILQYISWIALAYIILVGH